VAVVVAATVGGGAVVASTVAGAVGADVGPPPDVDADGGQIAPDA
jgi:hypothetical protein